MRSKTCPLCLSEETEHFHDDHLRSYRHCTVCDLVYVPSEFHLPTDRERAEYELHENTLTDPGYRQFLERLYRPLLERVSVGGRGLDFGCGYAPLLARMLEDVGYRMAVYDPFFANDLQVLDQHYDFITATEVVEHLAQPGAEIDHLFDLLKPGGVLAIMTKRVLDLEAFKSWHYKNDLTHISFFSLQTFEWIARNWQARLEVVDRDVVMLTKPSA